MEFYTCKFSKARKPHKCHICGLEIAPGELYYRESGMWEGDFFDRCTCKVCDRARQEYLDTSTENEYDDWSISDNVKETLCYGRKKAGKCEDDCDHGDPLLCPIVREHFEEVHRKMIEGEA